LRSLLSHGCLPLPAKAEDAIESLQEAVRKRKILDMDTKMERKRVKRYDDITKGLQSLKKLLHAMNVMGLSGLLGRNESPKNDNFGDDAFKCRPPSYVSIDLGARQRRKHMHGNIYFQAIILPEDYFQSESSEDNNETLLTSGGKGVKIAEGGRYDDLVGYFVFI